jgi:hypothetical protein
MDDSDWPGAPFQIKIQRSNFSWALCVILASHLITGLLFFFFFLPFILFSFFQIYGAPCLGYGAFVSLMRR